VYGVVPVDSDGTEVQYRGSAREDIEREPYVTDECPKQPLTGQGEVDNVERHDEDSHGQVCAGEGHDEVVLDVLEGRVREHGQNYEDVSQDRDEVERGHEHGE